ncbi:hypothetical protein CSB20_03990 [bacterium DOLZORAL124_64_63]|nr:MAG: hypothetical protein CSB20_03990 [bacterium DOLZORAL124_64_63]
MLNRKMLYLALLTFFTLAGVASAWAEDSKPLGVLDSRRIMEEYEAAKDALTQYQKFIRELELEVRGKEEELSSLMEEYESQKLLLGGEALKAKGQALEQKKAEYLQFQETLEQRAEAEYRTRITPITDQVQTIVERLGKEKGFGLIIDIGTLNVLYLDPGQDITNDVLSALARGDD